MNKLILIGNGFDLAHGLETSYGNFITWYLTNLCEHSLYEDKLIRIENPFNKKYAEFGSIQAFIQNHSVVHIKLTFKSDFFRDILDELSKARWVDIEYKYFQKLLLHYRGMTITNPTSDNNYVNKVKELNNSLGTIKEKLIKYLSGIDTVKYNDEIEKIFTKYLRIRGESSSAVAYFLDFNYTDTLQNYMHLFENENYEKFKVAAQVNYIHGNLKDKNNPVIFGYGDEMDPAYSKIEQLNQNAFLDNIKSFGYFRTNNYQSLTQFLNSPFEVFILGHSCGISDRILLNSIFDRDDNNCRSIRILHYIKSGKDDYFVKTQEISRHFKAENKHKMRNLIVPFDENDCMSKV